MIFEMLNIVRRPSSLAPEVLLPALLVATLSVSRATAFVGVGNSGIIQVADAAKLRLGPKQTAGHCTQSRGQSDRSMVMGTGVDTVRKT